LTGASVVIAATDDPGINRQVAEDGKLASILVNVVDDAAHSDFIVPSYFSRGDVTIAVSTAGKSPALARKIRANLENSFGDEFAGLATLISGVRSELKKRGANIDGDVWQEAIDLDALLSLLSKGKRKEAREYLLKKLQSSSATLETT
jgi:precorrin-2 dehydrogenase/sirohydrochlorin ferrochelatase